MAKRNRHRWLPSRAFSVPAEARGAQAVELAQPEPVIAWIQTPTTLRQVEAVALWFTPDAVLVERGFAQAAESAWVWKDAVLEREAPGSVRSDDETVSS